MLICPHANGRGGEVQLQMQLGNWCHPCWGHMGPVASGRGPLLPGQIVTLVSTGSSISSFIPSLYVFQNDINSPLWTLLGEHKRELAGRPKRKGG